MNLLEVKLCEDTTAANIATTVMPIGKGRIIKRGDRKNKLLDNVEEFNKFLMEAKDENLVKLYEYFDKGINGWLVTNERKFRQNFRKYATDKTVTSSLLKLIKYIGSQDKKPSSHSYPPDLYVHKIVQGKHAGVTWSHLKGQKIGLIFDVEDKKIILKNIGTHQDFGWK